MKKISKYISAITLGAMALASCSDNWEQPAFSVPEFPEGLKVNTTIKELKTAYWQSSDSYGTGIGRTADGDSIIIVGTIVSTTNPGNIYKSLYLQDATGAICIGIDTSAVSKAYPMGVAMAVNCTGLQIGRFNGLVQMGKADGSGVNRITMPELRPHVKLDYFMGKLDTITTDIPTLLEAMRTDEGKIEWQSRLVRINHVKFAEAGEPFTNGGTTSRNIVDDQGNRMIVYNSSYATFAYDKLPYGHGDIVGILSCYRNSWQLLLNDVDGLIAFDGEGEPETPDTPADFKAGLLDPNSADGTASWTIDNTAIWGWKTYSGKSYLNGSAYNQTLDGDAYAISPKVTLAADATVAMMQFEHAAKFQDAGLRTLCGVAVRVDGSSEWKALEIPNWPDAGSWSFAKSGLIDLKEYVGKTIQVAFKYGKGCTDTWEIRSLEFSSDAAIKIIESPVTPPSGDDTPADMLLGEDAANGIEGWNISNTEIWTWKTYNEKSYLNGSAYNLTLTADAWAVSPKIKVSEGGMVSFDHAAKFQTGLTTMCSLNIREAGATEWTKLNIPVWPEAGAWTFVNSGAIDLKAFAGKTVELGFCYAKGCNDTWEIRNLKLVNAAKAVE